MMDLDHFAGVNERLGHAGGDQALKAFAAVLRNGVRPADLIARYGGEEFSALLVGADAAEGARIAERIRTALAGLTIDVRGQAVNITVSTGVASLQPDDLRASIRRADEALYQAKSRGRNQVAVGRNFVHGAAGDLGLASRTTAGRLNMLFARCLANPYHPSLSVVHICDTPCPRARGW